MHLTLAHVAITKEKLTWIQNVHTSTGWSWKEYLGCPQHREKKQTRKKKTQVLNLIKNNIKIQSYLSLLNCPTPTIFALLQSYWSLKNLLHLTFLEMLDAWSHSAYCCSSLCPLHHYNTLGHHLTFPKNIAKNCFKGFK